MFIGQMKIDSEHVDCIKAWARNHAHHNGAPYSVTGKVVVMMAKAVASGDTELFGDACDLVWEIDDKYPCDNDPIITCL
jgi:hypothetical protein